MTARGFSFSVASPTGQMLYYDVTSETTVSVVNPDWDYYSMPSGRLEIPSTVTYSGSTFAVTAISQRAFSNCSDITHVIVPQSVRTIGTLAFFSCTSLDTIDLPSTIDSIASEAFNNSGYYNNMANWVDNTTLYVGDYLVRVRTSVTGSVTIREGTLGIGGMAMYNCHSMSEVVVPQSMRFIGALTFKDCSSLDTIHMLGTNPPTLATTAINTNSSITVKVPCGSLGAYTTAPNWNAQHIVEATCPDGIENIENGRPLIDVTATGIVVCGAEGKTLSVCDMIGRHIAQVGNASVTQYIDLPHTGVYVIVVDGSKSVKVIYL